MDINRCGYMASHMGNMSYQADVGQRMELSLEECESILAYLPLIVAFVIEERPKVKTK